MQKSLILTVQKHALCTRSANAEAWRIRTPDEAFWKAHSRMRGGAIKVDGALPSTINPVRRSSKLNHNLQTLNNTRPGFLFLVYLLESCFTMTSTEWYGA